MSEDLYERQLDVCTHLNECDISYNIETTFLKKIKNAILGVLFAIWELPQNIVALLLLGYYYIYGYICNKRTSYILKCNKGLTNVFVFESELMPSGISLGSFIIISTIYKERCDGYFGSKYYDTFKTYLSNTIQHEFGHCLQSKLLGSLYLFIIGLPSIIWNITYDDYSDVSYYSFYTEVWADELGGVNRQNN